MSWLYRQASGCLSDQAGIIAGVGYSGSPAGKNNPSCQDQKCVGPLPQGWYTISGPECTCTLPKPGKGTCPDCGETTLHKHGPFVLRLTPDLENEMFDRDGFLIHGDSALHPGAASEGCIAIDHATRHKVFDSGDKRLRVTA